MKYSFLLLLSAVAFFNLTSCESDDTVDNAVEDPVEDPAEEYPLLEDRSIDHDGTKREYRIYVPESYEDGEALPLVINMHGLTSNMDEQMLYSGFNQTAEDNDMIVVYPQGLEVNLGDGPVTHWNANFGTGVDDVGFLDQLIDEIYNGYGIDLSRVYTMGMSNGGYMSYTLGCELSERIAAIASVTGTMTSGQLSICDPGRAIPIIQFHGTADTVVPFDGSSGGVSIPDLIDFWLTADGCNAEDVTTTDQPDINTTDESTASVKVYDNCDENTEVILYTIDGGGHTWPGAFPLSGKVTNLDINATQLIVDFFAQHSHPDPKAVSGS